MIQGNYVNRHFIDEDAQMPYKHKKRCSKLLNVREIKFKTTMIYHYTSMRIVKK